MKINDKKSATYIGIKFLIGKRGVGKVHCNYVWNKTEILEMMGAEVGEKLVAEDYTQNDDPRHFILLYRKDRCLRTRALLVKKVCGDDGEFFEDITEDDMDAVKDIYEDLMYKDVDRTNLNIVVTPLCTTEQLRPLRELAYALEMGEGLGQNIREAMSLYKICANRGEPVAAYRLGKIYFNGPERFRQDAKDYLTVAAKAGLREAMTLLGKLAENTSECEEEKTMAYTWYKKAAEEGDDIALYNLGRCYHLEIGTSKDDKAAFDIFKKLADDDAAESMKDACWAVGMFYRDGYDMTPNYKEAIKYFNKGLKEGKELCRVELANMYRKGLGVDKDTDKAKRMLLESIKHGEKNAYYELGEMYEKDIRGKYHLYYAKEYYKIAERLPDVRAKEAFMRVEKLLAEQEELPDVPCNDDGTWDEPGFTNFADIKDEDVTFSSDCDGLLSDDPPSDDPLPDDVPFDNLSFDIFIDDEDDEDYDDEDDEDDDGDGDV